MSVKIALLCGQRSEPTEIVGVDSDFAGRLGRFYVNGERKFARIAIRHMKDARSDERQHG